MRMILQGAKCRAGTLLTRLVTELKRSPEMVENVLLYLVNPADAKNRMSNSHQHLCV